MGRIASGIGVIPAEEKMKQLVVFDLDGTLAKSKSPIDAKMAALLDKLLGVVKVAVISGANCAAISKTSAFSPLYRRTFRIRAFRSRVPFAIPETSLVMPRTQFPGRVHQVYAN